MISFVFIFRSLYLLFPTLFFLFSICDNNNGSENKKRRAWKRRRKQNKNNNYKIRAGRDAIFLQAFPGPSARLLLVFILFFFLPFFPACLFPFLFLFYIQRTESKKTSCEEKKDKNKTHTANEK